MHMRLLSEIRDRKTRIGGEQHRGWIGGHGVTSMPSLARDVEITFEIRDDNCGACLLSYYSGDNAVHGLISHRTVDDAKEAVQTWFAIPKNEWHDRK
jgi:hypothetical protein